MSCADHSGHHGVYLAVWDGRKWTKGSDWIEPLKDKVMPLIEADAQKYATANPAFGEGVKNRGLRPAAWLSAGKLTRVLVESLVIRVVVLRTALPVAPMAIVFAIFLPRR